MVVKVTWDNPEKTVIRQDLEGSWTWAEHGAAVDETHALMRTVTHTVDVIANIQGVIPMPSNALAYARRMLAKTPENAGVTAIVAGPGSIVRTLLTTFGKLYEPLSTKLILADTVEAAREALAAQRDSPE